MQYISGEARKPSIFVSSTCYDLTYTRNIGRFTRSRILLSHSISLQMQQWNVPSSVQDHRFMER